MQVGLLEGHRLKAPVQDWSYSTLLTRETKLRLLIGEQVKGVIVLTLAAE